jgi:2-furoyl-CoA dehydrogenase large subunit
MSQEAQPRAPYRYVGQKRRTKEDRRFIQGLGRFVADVRLPGMQHVALVLSPHPAARIRAIETGAARALPGVAAVVTGAELAQHINPILHGLDLPKVRWYPLAVGQVRYVGEWVVAVVASSRHVAEDAAELVRVDYEPLAWVGNPEAALAPEAPLVHPEHGSNLFYRRTFTWCDVAGDFARARHQLSTEAYWGRSATVPIETFGVVANWDPGNELLDVWASIQMPKYPDQMAQCLRLPLNAIRVHYDVDVGGSYGVKRGIKHSVLVGYLARKLKRPVRLIEDRLENMAGGDMHGPDRRFDVTLAFDDDGLIRSMKLRALDDIGCYPGRAPLQLGKPVGAIVGPYRIASVEYEAIAVATNKTSQVAVRGFGQAPTNYALECAVDQVARHLGMDRLALRRRNFIQAHEFPYRIPSGSEYDSGDYDTVLDKTVALVRLEALTARRDELRARGRLAGIGVATCLEPSGGNAAFEPLFNPANDTTTWMESCQIKVDALGTVTASIATSTAGQGHQTLVATVAGEELGIDPARIRVVHADSLQALPGNSPVASRMAIMLGGAAAGAARQIRERVLAIAAHNLQRPVDRLVYRDGAVFDRDNEMRTLSWAELVRIAHRKYHQMPPGMEPGLQATYVWEVPKGGTMPTADGRVQMYPCYAFECHIALVEIDRGTGQVAIRDWFMGHDCGTVINPDIVHGMSYGGVAHGIGAALYEEFAYDANGQLVAGSFVDYLLPSAEEIPAIHMVDHSTPSPLTPMGQKGSGESGYLGAPAAVASAVNDALAPLDIVIQRLPMRPALIAGALAEKETDDDAGEMP